MKLSFITNNLGMKIVALLVASGMWLFAAASMNNVAKMPGTIPVKIVNLGSNLTAIYDTHEVSVKISADSQIWRQLSSENFSAFVDANGLTAGTYDLKVVVSANQPNVQIVEVEPNNIMVRIEPIEKKEVPISALLTGTTADGRAVASVEFSPDKAEISGAKSVIDNISTVSAEIALAGESDNFSRAVPLKVLNDSGEEIKDVSINPVSTSASVSIIRSGNNKTLGIKVVTSGFPATGYFVSSIVADPAVIDIIGQDSILRQTQFIETVAIDLASSSDTITKTVALNLPSGVTLQKDSNPKVKVTITFSPNQITKEISASFNPTNVASNLKVDSFSPTGVKVIVSGPADVLGKLTAADVVLNLDFGGKPAGTVGIELTKEMFKLPAGVSLVSYLPSSFSVTLSSN